jgi:hypothetical protein
MSNHHPCVFFPMGDGSPPRVGWGYLVILGGLPWLAPTIKDAEAGITPKMHQLDPGRLEGLIDNETGKQFFLYQGALHERRH